MKEKEVAVVGKAKDVLINLQKTCEEEIQKGKKGTENQKILKSILSTIKHLKKNPHYGIQIKKKIIPKRYIERFHVNNLWKCNITPFWRMIYWVDGSNKVKIVSFVLDITDHKEYNKIFKYKKN